ncbi:MAG: extracellular solute-binding protein [Chloroflexales bacterium]|nr:extracellular solute-binding protein [Chloroflexales bacterium]
MIRCMLLVVVGVSSLLGACAFPGTPEPSPAAGIADRVVIGFGAPSDRRSIYAPLIDQFNADNPDVQVQFVDLDAEIPNRAAQPPDSGATIRQIVSVADTAVLRSIPPTTLAQGYLYDLQPLLVASAATHDDFFPGAFAGVTWNGGVFMLPRVLRIGLLSYNQDLWALRGLPAPAPDWTMADLLRAAERIATPQGDAIAVYGFAGHYNGLEVLAAELAAAGLNIFTTPLADLRLDDPRVVTALERMSQLAQSGALYLPARDNAASVSADSVAELVRTGRMGIWLTDQVAFEQAPDFAIGTLPFPSPALPFHAGIAQGYVISSGTRHPEAAWRWLTFLSQHETIEHLSIPQEAPARLTVADRSGYWQQLGEQQAAARAALAQSFPPPFLPENFTTTPSLDALFHTALATAASGEQSAGAALREAQAALDQALLAAQQTPQPTLEPGPIVVAPPRPSDAPAGATVISFIAGYDPANQVRQLAQTFNQQQSEVFVTIQDAVIRLVEPDSLASFAAKADCFNRVELPYAHELTGTLDVQPLLDADASLPPNDYPAALLAPFRRDGQLHGLPAAVNLRVLYANQTLFAQQGLAPPQATWTPNDLLQTAQQLTAPNERDPQYGFASPNRQLNDLAYVLVQSGTSITQGSGAALMPNYTDPQVVAAVQIFLALLQDASPHRQLQGYTSGPQRYAEFIQLINTGRVGMWFSHTLSPTDSGQRAFETAVAPLPLGERALTAADYWQTGGLYISPQSLHPEACWTWLNYLNSITSGLTRSFPVRRSVAESASFLAEAPVGAAAVYAGYRAALDRAPIRIDPADTMLLDRFWFYRAVDRALQGGDLEAELVAAQTMTKQHLACVRGGGSAGACARQVDPTYQGFAGP